MKVPWSDHEWKRVVVYGLGASGRAAVRLLTSRQVEVVGLDDRQPPAEVQAALLALGGVQLLTGRVPVSLPNRVDGVVVSPGVPPDRPLLLAARERGLPVIGEVELAFPFIEGPVIGVTGSNGKSTTTALTGALLKACGYTVEVCGNIGVPLTACVDGPADRTFVVELSSFQLETVVTFRPRAAALLNLSPDHLDRYEGMAAYRDAKAALFARQQPDDVAVMNGDDAWVRELEVTARRRLFSRLERVDDGCYVDGERVVETRPGEADVELFRCADVPLPGPHNLENAMAAALLARAVGAGVEGLRRGLGTFEGLPHRMQHVATWQGVAFYDDSKGTNVGATRRSLEGFPDASVHLILGGRNKGANPAELADIVRRKARAVYVIGEAAQEFGAALRGAAPIERAGDMATAVRRAAQQASSGEAVVLSPACASFDQYQDFNQRGDHFQQLVRELPKEVGHG
jgi:UDP-N-acetylmuramoylalanine--D-glutamate ligase